MSKIITRHTTLDPKIAELENLVVSFIDRAIKFDIELGRSKVNFFSSDYESVAKDIDQFRKKGFRVFMGGGNIFFFKLKKKLAGTKAICIQARGMARRKILIKEMTQ